MFVVLFEVQPRATVWQQYLDTAKLLRPELEAIDGFIDNVRFKSARTEGRLLSLSTWRDEKSLIRWRSHAVHHDQGQHRGRREIFADYRLRVAEVTADNQPPTGQAIREERFDETDIGAAKAATIVEPATTDEDRLRNLTTTVKDAAALIDVERYDSLREPHRPLLLASWATQQAASTWTATGAAEEPRIRVRRIRVIREYGMRERREAPQYFPDV